MKIRLHRWPRQPWLMLSIGCKDGGGYILWPCGYYRVMPREVPTQ